MIRRAIVHIGMPRTASTSLQAILTDLRPQLSGLGILYPRILPHGFLGPCLNHQPFGETLDGRRPRREKAECLEGLARELAGTDADTVILSYEDFALQQVRFKVPEILRTILERHGFAMEVAIVVKPQSEHLNSLYAHRAQLVREHRTFGQFACAVWRSGQFDYEALAAPWISQTNGRITAVPLRDHRSDVPLVERFFSALGLQDRVGPLIGASERTLVENRSPGPIAVETSRRLRRLRVREQTRTPPRDIGRFIDRSAWSKGWDETTFRGNDPEGFRRIDTHFAAANERFARTAWGQPWTAVVKEAVPRPPNELAGQSLSPDVEAQIATLMADAMAYFGFRRLPAWWSASADAVEAAAARLPRLVGYTGWRIR